MRTKNIVTTIKTLVKYVLTLILGFSICLYLVIYALVEISVSRLHTVNTAIYDGTVKIDNRSSAQDFAKIIIRDIDFFTHYRQYYPQVMTEDLDMIFCMAFRDNPSSDNANAYFNLVDNAEIKSLLISQAGYCFSGERNQSSTINSP